MRCNKARQEIIWERHHGAGSVVPFSLQAGNDIFFRFYLTKAELLALSLSDFDMSGNLLHINKTYNRIRKRDVIDTPKTENSFHTIDIPNFLKERYRSMQRSIMDFRKISGCSQLWRERCRNVSRNMKH